MSKAIAGAAILGAAGIAAALSFGAGGAVLEGLMMTKFGLDLLAGLALGGLTMEAGAIANALTSNRGSNITTRQAAGFRQIITGIQRVGGITIFASTTGRHHDQYNRVIVLAGHVVDSIENLYLDGRRVYWNTSSGGNVTRNGVNFGGSADGGNHVGPNGQTYNFGGLVYCEARFGDQAPTDYITGLTANDPSWAPSGGSVPNCTGCTYVYLKIVDNTQMFPGDPEIRFTVRGKNNIWDPRTGTRGFTANWALIVADVITDVPFGLGDTDGVNQAQLVAAANVCDEPVALAGGGTEARYACHFHYDTSMGPGDVLQAMMTAAAGRLSRIGGEWFIWPAYWQGPSFTFDANDMRGSLQWTPYRSFRDLFNRVTGTYVAPNYPYNDSGNLYDSSGFFDGSRANTFPFGFQPTSYPMYAKDVLHGYANDQYLEEDSGVSGVWASGTTYALDDVVIAGGVIYRSLGGGNLGNVPASSPTDWTPYAVELPREIGQQCCLSVSQAQRVAKIMLLRNRQQGSGTFPMSLAAWRMQPMDVMQFTFPVNGWTEKVLEVVGIRMRVEEAGGQGAAPSVQCEFDVQETDASVYSWSAAEELTVYDVPASPAQSSYTPAAPTSMTLTSSAATAVVHADGLVTPRVLVQWAAPLDGLVKEIQVQFVVVTGGVAGAWLNAPPVDALLNSTLVDGVVAGSVYNFRIRSVRANGAVSGWVEIDGYTVTVTLSTLGVLALNPGGLVGQAFIDGTAAILVEPFTARIGNVSVAVLPSGPFTITGLTQSQVWFVYYVDPTFAGGAITPIATQNQNDYLDKVGYFFIDSIVTPFNSSTGATLYLPSTFQDVGDRTTSTPEAAYDSNTGTSAKVQAATFRLSSGGPTESQGHCIFSGFPMVTTTAAKTLSVVASTLCAAGGTAKVYGYIGGTQTALLSTTSSLGIATYTMSIPSGTLLSDVSVEAVADAISATVGLHVSAKVSIAEIYIQ